jgi:hypothetical protein
MTELEQAMALVRAAGYRISKPTKPKSQTVNPFNHPFPHARLYNNTLTNSLGKCPGRIISYAEYRRAMEACGKWEGCSANEANK